MHYTFSDTFFAGVEFSSVYRLGNLFCTVPFRKITFLIDQVVFFFSIDSIFCSLKTGIHNVPSTNSQGRKMQSHDRRSWLTCGNTCVPPFLLVDTQVAQTLWDFVISQCMKINKIRPLFSFFFSKNRNIFACFQFFYAYYRKITILTDWFHTP